MLASLALLVFAPLLTAQDHPMHAGPPASPAATVTATVAGKTISISYSSPRVKGRAGKLFGKDGRIAQDPQYPIWRAGANAATTLHTDADLVIGGLAVPKGNYTLFVDISDPAHWVLVISKQTGEWGLSFDKAEELGRVKMETSATPALVEELVYKLPGLSERKSSGKLVLAWENVSAAVTVRVQ
jgi:hypothetical protein